MPKLKLHPSSSLFLASPRSSLFLAPPRSSPPPFLLAPPRSSSSLPRSSLLLAPRSPLLLAPSRCPSPFLPFYMGTGSMRGIRAGDQCRVSHASTDWFLFPVGRAGDVILWRSDLVHCGAPPVGQRPGFRAVSYTCMCVAIDWTACF